MRLIPNITVTYQLCTTPEEFIRVLGENVQSDKFFNYITNRHRKTFYGRFTSNSFCITPWNRYSVLIGNLYKRGEFTYVQLKFKLWFLANAFGAGLTLVGLLLISYILYLFLKYQQAPIGAIGVLAGAIFFTLICYFSWIVNLRVESSKARDTFERFMSNNNLEYIASK